MSYKVPPLFFSRNREGQRQGSVWTVEQEEVRNGEEKGVVPGSRGKGTGFSEDKNTMDGAKGSDSIFRDSESFIRGRVTEQSFELVPNLSDTHSMIVSTTGVYVQCDVDLAEEKLRPFSFLNDYTLYLDLVSHAPGLVPLL